MKKKLLYGFLLMGTVTAFAQKQDCPMKASVYVEAAKLKNYDEAYPSWKFVYDNCPELYQSTFQYGERILRDKISKGVDKDKYIKDLQELYNKYNQYFPQKFSAANNQIHQAYILIEHNKGTKEELFALLDGVYKQDKDAFADDTAIYQYFATALDLYKANKKPLQEVFDVYDNVSEIIENENNKLSVRMNELLPKEEANTLTDKE